MEHARAWVLGNLDLVRPLVATGTPCVGVAARNAPVGRSRLVDDVVTWPADVDDAQMATVLCRAARDEAVTPVLYPGTDRALLLVARQRERLGRSFRFLVEETELVETLVDKVRFAALADRLALPVPTSIVFHPDGAAPRRDLSYPCLIKPVTRDVGPWVELFNRRKAVLVRDRDELARIWDRLVAAGQQVVAQVHVPGPESRIESYHAYWDASGTAVAEFTGRKIRTWPPRFGNSTALETTDADDVRRLGRSVVAGIGLRGVVKVDVKRDDAGRLWLLEVNPRFSLWHGLGAVAGLNLPALVHADLTGRPRPPVGVARAGATWMHPDDVHAARADAELSWSAWLRFAASADTRSNLALDDPWPALGHVLGRGHRRPRGVPDEAPRTPVVASDGGA